MTMDWELGRAQGGRYPTVATQQQPKPGDIKQENVGDVVITSQWVLTGSDKYGNPIYGWDPINTYRGSTGTSTGATWKEGEQAQEESKLALSWLKYQSDLLNDEQTALSNAWQNAVMAGNLELQKEVEANQVKNRAEINRINEQTNAVSVYSSQLTSRASLASTAANVATTASEWAANPRNETALLKLQETGLLGGSATPLNAAQYNPETMGAYGTALDQRFGMLFGGVGKQLADALAATNQTPVAAQPWYQSDPNYGSLNPNQQAIARNYSPEERGQYQNFMNMTPLERSYVTGRGGNVAPTAQQSQDVYAGLSDEGKRYVQEVAKRGTPSMAGGGKMTVNEPTGLVGLISKKLYATIAEDAPEQVTITPMKKATQGEGGGIPGVQSFATGGSIYNWDTPASQIKPVQVSSMPKGSSIFGGNGIPSRAAQGAAYGNASTPGTFGSFGAGLSRALDQARAGRVGRAQTPLTAQRRAELQAQRAAESAAFQAKYPSLNIPSTATLASALAGGYRKRGGTAKAAATAPTVPITGPGGTLAEQDDSPEMKLAKQFAATLKPLGIDYTPTPGNYAPPPNLLVGKSWANLQKFPSILAMLEAMASLSGQPWGDFSSEVNMFQPTAPRYSSVSYGW